MVATFLPGASPLRGRIYEMNNALILSCLGLLKKRDTGSWLLYPKDLLSRADYVCWCWGLGLMTKEHYRTASWHGRGQIRGKNTRSVGVSSFLEVLEIWARHLCTVTVR
jgi:hypothetical protein